MRRPKRFLSAGGGLAFGTEIERPGLQGTFYYSLFDQVPNLLVGSDITLFLPRSEDTTVGNTTLETSLFLLTFDFNAHYVFFGTPTVNAYGIGGLELAYGRVSTESLNLSGTKISVSDGDIEFGIDLGAGAEFDVGFALAYAELKFAIVGDFDQLVLAGGLRWDMPL